MLVSVIIPCYNVKEFINECLQSVLQQVYKNIEIICIDNNSSDTSWTNLVELKEKYPFLIIEKELKAGANAARNKGLEIAKGEWIQFLDADDLLEPNKILHQVELIKNANHNFDFVIASYFRKPVNEIAKLITIDPANYYVSAFINECGITSSNLWNKQTILDVGKWDEDIKSSQETELMLRLVLSNKKYILDNEPLTIIRERESGQISQGNPEKKWKQYIDVRLNYIERLRLNHFEEYKIYSNMLFDFLMVSVLTLAKYDKNSALLYYKKNIRATWNSSYSFGFSKIKVLIIKSFGLNFFIRINMLINR